MKLRQHDSEAAQRPVTEGGGGESEGFELAEQELIEHASHADEHSAARVLLDAPASEVAAGALAGEADFERSSELDDDENHDDDERNRDDDQS